MDETGVQIVKLNIISVNVFPGSNYVHYWRQPMQEVKTSEGVFIDNMEGRQFGDKRGKPGFNWIRVIGQDVIVRIIDCDGFLWINQM